MSAILWVDVTAIAPELTAINPTAQGIFLAFANAELAPSIFGGEDAPKLKLARIYLAAHLATLSSAGGNAAAGPVISESTGRISRTYANLVNGATSASDWVSTPYGQLYLRLVRTSRSRLPRTF